MCGYCGCCGHFQPTRRKSQHKRRIVARVDELIALCDRLEASLAHGLRRLLDAILDAALTPECESAPSFGADQRSSALM